MEKNFRTYDLAVSFYRQAQLVKLPVHVKNQFDRASLSIALNLREGRGRNTRKDQLRFFHTALGSARECQGVLDLHPEAFSNGEHAMLDRLAASIYLLVKNAR